MACQPPGRCEDAESSRPMISSMLSSLVDPSRTHVSPEGKRCIPSGCRTQQPANDGCTTWKWACFRSGAKFEPLSRRLQPGIRFFHDPITPRPTGRLGASLPAHRDERADGGAYHVPLIADSAVVIRECLSVWGLSFPGSRNGDVLSFATSATGDVPFGCGLTAGLATQSLPGFSR
jgi:hypothetical protein